MVVKKSFMKKILKLGLEIWLGSYSHIGVGGRGDSE